VYSGKRVEANSNTRVPQVRPCVIKLRSNGMQLFTTTHVLPPCVEVLVALGFFLPPPYPTPQFWPLVLFEKNCASIIYYVCCMIYYRMYFKLGVSFYTFAIKFFPNKTNGQSCRKRLTTGNISVRRECYSSESILLSHWSAAPPGTNEEG
jgi:hypothetical protein